MISHSVIHCCLLSFRAKNFLAEFGPIYNSVESFLEGFLVRNPARFKRGGVVFQVVGKFAENLFLPARRQPQFPQTLFEKSAIVRHLRLRQ